MNASSWLQNFDNEINQAITARNSGNEGMARVCARRAVGVVLGVYFTQQGIDEFRPGAYDRIKYLVDHPDVSNDVRGVASHFLIRVNEEHNLPLEVDLIADAQWLKARLLDQ